jgi:hypothetical protein
MATLPHIFSCKVFKNKEIGLDFDAKVLYFLRQLSKIFYLLALSNICVKEKCPRLAGASLCWFSLKYSESGIIPRHAIHPGLERRFAILGVDSFWPWLRKDLSQEDEDGIDRSLILFAV